MNALEVLQAADAEMNSIHTGDLDRLQASIERRALLIQNAVGEMEQMRRAGLPVPAEARQALEQSMKSGMHSMRQIILAKHMLATELGRLKQERQLLGALTGEQHRVGAGLQLRG